MIHTNTLSAFSKGLNLLIKPNERTIPKGIATIKVKRKIKQVRAKPPRRLCVTSKKLMEYTYCVYLDSKAEVILTYSILYFSAKSFI